MREDKRYLTRLQVAFYLVEVAVLSGMLALAAGSSPEFALGPIARTLAAAALPLPCHVLLLAHLVWTGRALRRRSFQPVLVLRPQASLARATSTP